MKGELQWKAIEEKNAAIKWGEFTDSLTSSEDGDTPQAPSPRVDQSLPTHIGQVRRMPMQRHFAQSKSTTSYSPFLP
jgi:hypothetical protein